MLRFSNYAKAADGLACMALCPPCVDGEGPLDLHRDILPVLPAAAQAQAWGFVRATHRTPVPRVLRAQRVLKVLRVARTNTHLGPCWHVGSFGVTWGWRLGHPAVDGYFSGLQVVR